MKTTPDNIEKIKASPTDALRLQPGLLLRQAQRLSRVLSATPGARRAWAKMSRPLRRQVARSAQRELCTEFDHSLRIIVRLNDQIESQLFWYGFQQGDLPALWALQRSLRPGADVLDIGANIGAFTLSLASRLEDGTVHAFEPVSEHVNRLDRNIRINNLRNIAVNHCAVTSEPGRVTMGIPVGRWMGALTNTGRSYCQSIKGKPASAEEEGTREEHVDGVPIDQYVTDQRIRDVCAIKLDIEGVELDALRGSAETLRRFGPTIVMEVNAEALADGGKGLNGVMTFWQSVGYTVGRILPSGKVDWTYDPRGHLRHHNICCVPAGSIPPTEQR